MDQIRFGLLRLSSKTMKLQSFLSSEELLRVSVSNFTHWTYDIFQNIQKSKSKNMFVYVACLTKGRILGICQSRLRRNNGCPGEAPASAAAALAAAAERGHAKVVSTLRCLDLPFLLWCFSLFKCSCKYVKWWTWFFGWKGWKKGAWKKCQENSIGNNSHLGWMQPAAGSCCGPRPCCWQPGLCWSEGCCHLWAFGGGRGPLVQPRVFRLNTHALWSHQTDALLHFFTKPNIGMPPQTFKIWPESWEANSWMVQKKKVHHIQQFDSLFWG